MVPRRCPMLPTVTTRDPGTVSSRSRTSPVNAKGPRWLVAMVDSKPSSVTAYCGLIPCGVVDEQVQARVVGPELFGRAPDRGQ